MRYRTILLVYVALAALWSGMAATLQQRHSYVDHKLRSDVFELWGGHHVQQNAFLRSGRELASADIETHLKLDYRKKGQYWYSTFSADFKAEYRLGEDRSEGDTFVFPLPRGCGMFSDFQVQYGGQVIEKFQREEGLVEVLLPAGQDSSVTVTYSSQGSDMWWYYLGDQENSTRDVRVVVTTDFDGFNFPDGGVSPTRSVEIDGGHQLTWEYNNLLSGGRIGLELPQKTNPGPVYIDICRFGPLGLLLFYVGLTLCALEQGKSPHPMHYIFLSGAFFSFNLLLVYLGDQLPLWLAFILSALASLFMSLSYASRVLGVHFARTRVVPVQVLYQLVFSSAFLNAQTRGVSLVVLLVVSLHLTMQITAKVDWDKGGIGEASELDANI